MVILPRFYLVIALKTPLLAYKSHRKQRKDAISFDKKNFFIKFF
jgi:hypothetical protein